MRLYQVALSGDNGVSFGYEYFATRREANTRRAQWIDPADGDPSATADITTIDVECTKVGIVAALNRYASHNDNG